MDSKTILISRDFVKSLLHHINNSYIHVDQFIQGDPGLPRNLINANSKMHKILEFSRKLTEENLQVSSKIDWKVEILEMVEFLSFPGKFSCNLPSIEVSEILAFRYLNFELLSRANNFCLKNSALVYEIQSLGPGVQIRLTIENADKKIADSMNWKQVMDASILKVLNASLQELNDFPSFTMVVNCSKGIKERHA